MAIAGAGVIVAVAIIPKEFFLRQASLVTEGTQDQSLDRRSSYVKVAVEAIEDRPLIGWGTDTFKKLWVKSEETRWFKMEERPAHNTYLEVTVGSGFVGLALFLLLMGYTFFNFHSAEKRLLHNGFESQGRLCGAYKLSLLAVMLYFLIKSGLDHKYFLMIIPLSTTALRFADHLLAKKAPPPVIAAAPETVSPDSPPSTSSVPYIPRRHARRNANP